MIALFILAFLDVAMITLITFGLISKGLTEFENIGEALKTYGTCFVTTLILGLIAYYGGGHVHRVSSIFIVLGLIKIISGETWSKVSSIYLLVSVLIFTVQGPALLIFYFTTFEVMTQFLIGQGLSFGIIIVLFMKEKLPKMLWYTEDYVVVKFTLFLLVIFFQILLFIANFDYALLHLIFYSAVCIGVIFISLYVRQRIQSEYSELKDRHDVLMHAIDDVMSDETIGKNNEATKQRLNEAVESIGYKKKKRT